MFRGTVVLVAFIICLGLTPVSLLGQRGGGSTTTLSTSSGYLSGHVAFEDGSRPTEKVIIRSMCGGTVREETTVDRKGGGFGFTLGSGSGDLMLETTNRASRAAPGAVANMRQCALEAVLSGYTSDVVYLANLEPTKPDVGTIILHKASGAAAGGPSDTAKQASKDAQKAFGKGAEAAKNAKWLDAATNFRKATELFPGYADAWLELGKVQVEQKQVDEARKSYEAAIKADEKYSAPYVLLIQIENQAQNWKGVTDLAGRLFKMNPAAPPLIYFQASAAYYRLRNFEASESAARQGLKMDTQHQAPKLHQVLASCLMVRGDMTSAISELKQYLETAPFASDADRMKAQIADLEAKAQAAPAKP